MSLIEFNPSLLETLKDRVVVLTGGAMGVGRSAVKQFHGIYLTPTHNSKKKSNRITDDDY
jgi:hypothetical protein